MPHSPYRTLSQTIVLCCISWLLPNLAYAEVSDKIISPAEIWNIAAIFALFSGIASAYSSWSIRFLAFLPLLWFASLFFEIYFSDIASAIYAEQGPLYYLHACLALSLVAAGIALGHGWRTRRQSKQRDS